MKQALTVVVALAVSMPAVARADDTQDKWRTAFAASVMVTGTGATMLLWGRNRIDTAEHALCTGDYMNDCGHAPPATANEVDDLNAKGTRGQTVARVGVGVMLVGLVLTGVTGYEGFAKPPKEQTVSVQPAVSPQGAGATLTLRW